jgi:hypothetical protein
VNKLGFFDGGNPPVVRNSPETVTFKQNEFFVTLNCFELLVWFIYTVPWSGRELRLAGDHSKKHRQDH